MDPVCLRVNATSLDQDLDQNARVNGAIVTEVPIHIFILHPLFFCSNFLDKLVGHFKDLLKGKLSNLVCDKLRELLQQLDQYMPGINKS